MEKLQKVKADEGEQNSPMSFKALFAMRQSKEDTEKRCKDCKVRKACFEEAEEVKPDWTARRCGDYERKPFLWIFPKFWRPK